MESSPAFSVVVPVYNIAEYLAPCLESILEQAFDNLEVILVDDASTDASLTVARRYADHDPRIRILLLPTNGGLGMARNAGIDAASAPYLMFVDGDDTLATGALQAVAERIERDDDPDVVMFGYESSYPDGRIVPGTPTAVLLARSGRLDAEQRIPLLRITPVAWNKAYSREYLLANGLRFPKGVYEDLSWTYQVLMSAPSLVTMDQVCYQYRQHPGTSRLSLLKRWV